MHLMVDLETWGTSNDAMIVGVGAVLFNKEGIHSKFSRCVNPKSSSGTLDPGTILWWMDKMQRDALDHWLSQPKYPLRLVLEELADFTPSGVLIWGNGATFDNVILRSAYEREGLTYPTKFYNDRCYRTVKNLHPHIKLKRKGVYHDAGDDAESQALHLIEMDVL